MMEYEFIKITDQHALIPHSETKLYQGFDPRCLVSHAPDAHWLVVDQEQIPVARCSLWWRDVPPMENERLGVIGHYATMTQSASDALLAHVNKILKQQGCTLAVGPMNGNTWRSYRFVTESKGAPTFFLEPSNPVEWPRYWQAAGFEPLSTYSSGLTTDLALQDARLPRVEKRMRDNGISLRPLNVDDFENELKRIFSISLISFSKNYLYTPLDEQEFIQQYSQVKPLVQPALTLLAEQADKAVGFLFAIPDMHEQQRGEPLQTVIIKTVAVLPGSRQAGLGALMVDMVQQQARKMGMTRVIHALMHDSNHSRNISGHYANTMRRYTLYSRRL